MRTQVKVERKLKIHMKAALCRLVQCSKNWKFDYIAHTYYKSFLSLLTHAITLDTTSNNTTFMFLKIKNNNLLLWNKIITNHSMFWLCFLRLSVQFLVSVDTVIWEGIVYLIFWLFWLCLPLPRCCYFFLHFA